MSKVILLCTSNPILVKNLYGILRDEGYVVDTVEHPAFAVQSIMERPFDLVIMDSEPFGLSAEDAILIMKTVTPDMPVLSLGEKAGVAAERPAPLDLQKLTRAIHAIAA